MLKTFIPYGRQDIDENDIASVVDILRSDWLTQGPNNQQFEQAVATHCHAKYATAVNSATSALHIACLALGLGKGDQLWTTPNTFVASANCGLYCGASVDFVDIDPQTYNISVTELAAKLKQASLTGGVPKVVVVVHFAGQSCDMQAIHRLSLEYGFAIIEDASHAIGGQYQQQPIGCCAYSDLTIFSFHPVKIITTAEGGMVVTNNPVLKEKCDLLRSHGITRNPVHMKNELHGPWYYEQIDLGFNYRMTDLQAALGLSQLRRIDQFINRRHELAAQYVKGLQSLPVILPWQCPQNYSGYHLYPIQIKLAEISLTRLQVFEALREAGIGVNVHYIPVHTQPYYQQLGFKATDFPQSLAYYQQAISLPMYSSLSDENQAYVIAKLHEILG